MGRHTGMAFTLLLFSVMINLLAIVECLFCHFTISAWFVWIRLDSFRFLGYLFNTFIARWSGYNPTGKAMSFILTNLCITAYLCIVLISDFEMGTKRETWHFIWISQSKWIHVLWCYCCADAISLYLFVASTPATIYSDTKTRERTWERERERRTDSVR